MNPVPREQGMTEEQLQEFLDKGGKIQKFAYGERTEDVEFKGAFYKKRKSQKEEKDGTE